MRWAVFFVFAVFLIGWSVALVAEDFKYFDVQKREGELRILDENYKGFAQSKLGFTESDKRVEMGGIDKLTEKQLQSEQGFFNKNIQPSGNAFISNNLVLSLQSVVDGGSSFVDKKIYYGYGYDIFNRFQEEMRINLGENLYERLIWTYDEIKGLDRWINLNVSQYGFGDGALLVNQRSNIMDLDNRLNFLVVLQRGNNAGFFSDSDGNRSWNKRAGDRAFFIEGQQDGLVGGQLHESKFVTLLNYLNIFSFIYYFSVIFIIVALVKLFKSLAREKKWS